MRRREKASSTTGSTYILVGMETNSVRTDAEERAGKAGKAVKWAFVLGLAAAAAIIGFFTIFRTHPAQATVQKAFDMVEEGNMDGFMACVDPEGQLGRLWDENAQGVRDAVISLLQQHRLEFSSLKFTTKTQRGAAEVELKGGRVSIYDRHGEGTPEVFFDLKDSGLVFYLEEKGGAWLIEGVNYYILELFSGDMDILPF